MLKGSLLCSWWSGVAFIVVIVTCKHKEDPSKNEGTRVVTTFLLLKSMGIFPDAKGQLTPQPEV